jgi:hypothetical protein
MSPKIFDRSILSALAVCALLWGGCSHSVTSLNPAKPLILPDSVKTLLNGEAPIIGFYAALAQDSSYLDSIPLPQWAETRAYQALGFLWQNHGMPERDTVFDIYQIQEIGDNDFHTIGLCDDTPVGVQVVLNKYEFTADTNFQGDYKTPLFLNTIAVVAAINDSLNNSVGFSCAQTDSYVGVADFIQAIFEQTAVVLNCSHGWNDCFSGCLGRRNWSFRVFDSGVVNFLGASGDPPPN